MTNDLISELILPPLYLRDTHRSLPARVGVARVRPLHTAPLAAADEVAAVPAVGVHLALRPAARDRVGLGHQAGQALQHRFIITSLSLILKNHPRRVYLTYGVAVPVGSAGGARATGRGVARVPRRAADPRVGVL